MGSASPKRSQSSIRGAEPQRAKAVLNEGGRSGHQGGDDGD
jgi:hypothetical protein